MTKELREKPSSSKGCNGPYLPILCQIQISQDQQSGNPSQGSLLCVVYAWCVLHCTKREISKNEDGYLYTAIYSTMPSNINHLSY